VILKKGEQPGEAHPLHWFLETSEADELRQVVLL